MPKNNSIILTGMVYQVFEGDPDNIDIDLSVSTEFDDGHISSDVISIRLERATFPNLKDSTIRHRKITVKGFVRVIEDSTMVFAERIAIYDRESHASG